MFLEPSQNPAAKTDQPTQTISTAPTKHKPELPTAETLEDRYGTVYDCPPPTQIHCRLQLSLNDKLGYRSHFQPKSVIWWSCRKNANTSDTDLRQGIRTAAWITVITNFKYKVHAHDTFGVGGQVR